MKGTVVVNLANKVNGVTLCICGNAKSYSGLV